jgi:hypothetical protein
LVIAGEFAVFTLMLWKVVGRKLVSNWVTALGSSLKGLDYMYPEI